MCFRSVFYTNRDGCTNCTTLFNCIMRNAVVKKRQRVKCITLSIIYTTDLQIFSGIFNYDLQKRSLLCMVFNLLPMNKAKKQLY